MTWIAVLELLLRLVALVARQAERRDIEKAVTHELEILQGTRVRRAADARDAVDAGVVPDDDKYRRD